MIIRTAAKTTSDRLLLYAFYVLTIVWVLALLAPFGWLISSALKNRISVFKMPPEWIPAVPRVAEVTLEYTSEPTREMLLRDGAVAMWSIWDQYGRESVWGVEVRAFYGGRRIFACEGPSYELKHLRDMTLIAAVLDPDMITRHTEELMAGIDHTFEEEEGGSSLRSERPTAREEGIRSYLVDQGLHATPDVRLRRSFWRFLDPFKSAWLYMFDTPSSHQSFGRFILNSTIVTGAVIVLQLLISSLAAYALSRLFGAKAARYLLLFFVATMMIPPMLLFIPLYLMMKAFPFAHIPFTEIVLPAINLLDPELPAALHPMVREAIQTALSYMPLILPHTAWGLSVLLFKGFFDQLPAELIEAARLDGASEFKIFSQVVAPLSKSVFSVMALWTFFAVWQDFLWPYIVSIVQPQELWTYPVALFYQQNIAAYANEVMALAVLASFPTILAFVVFQRFIERGIVWTGLKG